MSEEKLRHELNLVQIQVASLKIALAETVSLLVQRSSLTKREAVSHFQGLGDLVMPNNQGETGAKVFEDIANYILEAPLPE